MTRERNDADTTGVGPGITGASGELIEGTGGDRGIGGTGHHNEMDAAGMRPQDRYTARPDAGTPQEGDTTTRPSGSASGTVGGGGPTALPASGGDAGRPGGGGSGVAGDIAGGVRNVTPADEQESDADIVHSDQGRDGSARATHIRAGNPGTDDEH